MWRATKLYSLHFTDQHGSSIQVALRIVLPAKRKHDHLYPWGKQSFHPGGKVTRSKQDGFFPYNRCNNRVHHNEPCLSRRCRCQPKRSILQVEVEFGLVFPRIRHLPVLERDCNIVEEPAVGTRQRSQRKADDTNIIEEEQRVELVSDISRPRSRPATPIIHRVEAMKHLQCLWSAEAR